MSRHATGPVRITEVDRAVERLDAWLESLRGPGGYGGPVVHWWRDNLVFCGAGLDWRYEGIIGGYLALFERSGAPIWLERAFRAGDDLVSGQLDDGSFRNSRFEQNPGRRGTPHEAAAAVGLLLLAKRLREEGRPDWERYRTCAARNLTGFYLGRCWNEIERRFRDDPSRPSFVPNKAATLIEALVLLAQVEGDETLLQRYVRPTAEAIAAHQVNRAGHRLDGGIAQNSLDGRVVEAYFPYYIARCVPGLLAAAEALDEPHFVEAALQAGAFLLRWREPDGGFPQVIYADGRVNRHPRWVAASGDILRAFDLLRARGLPADREPTLTRLLNGQQPSGGFRVAEGFAGQITQRATSRPPDARDLLPVAGWSDKAFRYLAGLASTAVQVGTAVGVEAAVACHWYGRAAELREDDHQVEVLSGGRAIYRWRKGATWAETLAEVGA